MSPVKFTPVKVDKKTDGTWQKNKATMPNGRRVIATSTSFEQAFKNIDDVLRKEAGCTTELDYTEQTSWLLFLKYLDGLEEERAMEGQLDGKKYLYILEKSFRWESWAAPKNAGKIDHNKAL